MDTKKALKFLEKFKTAEEAVKLTGKPREEYLKALDVAYGDKATRAKDMGFGERTFYHGSTVPIDKFQTEALGKSTGAQSAKKGFFFAEDPSTASDYANLASEKGVIREGDTITTKLESDNYDISNKHYSTIDDAKFAWKNAKHAQKYIDDHAASISSLKKQVENPKVWDWMKTTAAREGISPEQYAKRQAMESLKKVQARTPAPVPTEKQLKDLENKYYQSIKDYAAVNGDDKILAITREGLKGAELKRFDDLVKSGTDIQNSTGQHVLPVRLKGNPDSIHVKDYKGQGYRDTTYADELTEMEKNGKDAALFRNTYDPADPNNRVKQDIAVVTKPNQIRSTNAAFDPRFKESDLIMAANGNNKGIAARLGDAISAPQRYAMDKIAGMLGVKGDAENSENSARAIIEKAASLSRLPEGAPLNAAKALGVAGLEVFADPTNAIPVGKIGKGLGVLAKAVPGASTVKAAADKVPTFVAERLKILYNKNKDKWDNAAKNSPGLKATLDKIKNVQPVGSVTNLAKQGAEPIGTVKNLASQVPDPIGKVIDKRPDEVQKSFGNVTVKNQPDGSIIVIDKDGNKKVLKGATTIGSK